MEVLYRLSYRGIFCSWGREDSNLRRRSRQIYSLLPLAARAHPRPRPRTAPEGPIMVANAADFSTEPGKGFEPPTCRLQGGCSTAELPGHKSHQLLASRLATVTRLPTAILAGGSAAPSPRGWKERFTRNGFCRWLKAIQAGGGSPRASAGSRARAGRRCASVGGLRGCGSRRVARRGDLRTRGGWRARHPAPARCVAGR